MKAAELPLIPDKVLQEAAPVKANPVRRVLRCGDIFLKVDSRGPKRLLAEAESAALLKQHGIPVTEILYVGRTADGSGVLATRAFPGVSVTEHLFRHGADADFCDAFAAFVKKILESGLWHGDFHVGNVLYDALHRQFCLVDPYGVRRRHWFDAVYRMQRILLELRLYLPPEKLLEVIRFAGIPMPEGFYAKGLLKEAAALNKEWPKRRRQIAADYPKFIRVENQIRRIVFPCPSDEAGEEKSFPPAEADSLFYAHFYLTLAGIPHRAVLGRSADEPQKLWLSTRPSAFPPPVEALQCLPDRILALYQTEQEFLC